MRTCLIALDLDGTLLGGIKPYGIRPAALQAMAQAHAQGMQFALATGRGVPYIDYLCTRYPVLRQVLAGLVTEERYVFLHRDGVFEPDSPFNEAALALERAILPAVTEQVASHWPELLELDNEIVRIQPELEAERGFIELVFSTAERAAQGVIFLQAVLPTQVRAVSNVRNVCLRHLGVSKGQALRRLAERLGIAYGSVIAVGDACNDWSMLEGAAGFQAATTANAQPQIAALVRSRGGYVAGQPYGDGVAEIIMTAVAEQQTA